MRIVVRAIVTYDDTRRGKQLAIKIVYQTRYKFFPIENRRNRGNQFTSVSHEMGLTLKETRLLISHVRRHKT